MLTVEAEADSLVEEHLPGGQEPGSLPTVGEEWAERTSWRETNSFGELL